VCFIHQSLYRAPYLTKLNFKTHGSLGNVTSDLFRLLSVVGAYEYAGGGHKFCAEHFVRPKVSNMRWTPNVAHCFDRRWRRSTSLEPK
jgi:hypothetical protein